MSNSLLLKLARTGMAALLFVVVLGAAGLQTVYAENGGHSPRMGGEAGGAALDTGDTSPTPTPDGWMDTSIFAPLEPFGNQLYAVFTNCIGPGQVQQYSASIQTVQPSSELPIGTFLFDCAANTALCPSTGFPATFEHVSSVSFQILINDYIPIPGDINISISFTPDDPAHFGSSHVDYFQRIDIGSSCPDPIFQGPTPTNPPTASQTPTDTPTATQTSTATQIPTSTASQTPTATGTPSLTPTNTPTDSQIPIDTPTATQIPTSTASQTSTATGTPSQTPTATQTPTNTSTSTATNAPTNTPTRTPTATQTPPSLHYIFSGFFPPVDNLPTFNTVKAGAGVPLSFSLKGNQGLNIFVAGSPSSQAIPCNVTQPVDAIELTIAVRSSSLTYLPLLNSYIYTWKTETTWTGTCRQLTIKLRDGSEHKVNFKFK